MFVLLAALAALATTFAACGSSDSGGSEEDPQAVVDSATLEGVKSADIDLSLGVKAEGDEGGDVDISLSGPFQSQGAEDLPQLDLEVQATGSAAGDDIDFDGGLTLLGDRAFVNYEGTEYEVDPTTFGFVKSAVEQAQRKSGAQGGSADATACQKAAAGLEIAKFVDELTDKGGVDVDGTSTTQVSGDLDVGAAVDAIIDLSKDPACSSQLEAAGPLPLDELEQAKGELTSAIKKAHIDVFVGEDDIIRRVVAEVTVEPADSKGEKVEIDLDLSLSGVNEEQEISAPSGAKPLEGLFEKLGVNPLELLEAGSGEGGFEGLLEGIIGGSGGGSSGGESSAGAGQQAYLDCLQAAQTPADLQKCASKRS
jgi:hypothetical protein